MKNLLAQKYSFSIDDLLAYPFIRFIRACELPGIRVLPLEGVTLRRVAGLVYHQTEHLSEFALALVTKIKSIAQDRKNV